MDIDFVELGKRLKELRVEKGYTQAELSELSGISIMHIGNIENARKEVGLRLLVKYCDALGITVDYILGRSHRIADESMISAIMYRLTNCTTAECDRIIRIIDIMLEDKNNNL